MYNSSKPSLSQLAIVYNTMHDSPVRSLAQTDYGVQHNFSAILHEPGLLLDVSLALKLFYPLLLNKQWRHSV